jgi:hypothetical protein
MGEALRWLIQHNPRSSYIYRKDEPAVWPQTCGLEADVAGQDHAAEVELFHACGLAAIERQIAVAH